MLQVMKQWRYVALAICLITAIMMMPAIGDAGFVSEEILDASGQWLYILWDDNTVTITGHGSEKPNGDLIIPSEIDGYAVVGMADAFRGCADIVLFIEKGDTIQEWHIV